MLRIPSTGILAALALPRPCRRGKPERLIMKSDGTDIEAAQKSARRPRGRKPTDPGKRRDFFVKVAISPEELGKLDRIRGRYPRASWMRMTAFGFLPPRIPEINMQAWVELSRASSNLNQIAARLNRRGMVEAAEVQSALKDFRNRLIGLDSKDIIIEEEDEGLQ